MSQKYVLGFDIGTSSVKASIVELYPNSDRFEIKSQSKCYYNEIGEIKSTPNNLPINYSQQNVKVIFETIENVLKQIRFNMKIDLISVCGQMHGCVLWNQKLIDHIRNSMSLNLDFNLISDHYDWTDGRCDENFLKTLPIPDCYADTISSGFGCATLFWLKRYQENYLNRFNKCGTIMEWFVCLLCCLDQVPISTHNAHSWGYFDPNTNYWNLEILKESGFPVHLLPNPVNINTVVGRTKMQWHFISPDIPVLVAFGDLQSIMHLALKDDINSIVLNLGTSAQLCRLITKIDPIPKKSLSPMNSLDYYPYDNKQYLLVAASLNGGNVLQSFINFLQSIIKCLTDIDLNESDIWTKLFQHYNYSQIDDDPNVNLCIEPTLFGERYDPKRSLSIIVQSRLPTLIELTQCLCNSLIENLIGMMKYDLKEIIESNSSNAIKTNIICTGSLLAKNPILKQSLQRTFCRIVNNKHLSSLDIKYLESCDADVGCAFFAFKQILSFNQTNYDEMDYQMNK